MADSSSAPVAVPAYLQPEFKLEKLTMPVLRGILLEFEVAFPSAHRKAQLVELVRTKVLPKRLEIVAALNAPRTTEGIEDVVFQTSSRDSSSSVAGGSSVSCAQTEESQEQSRLVCGLGRLHLEPKSPSLETSPVSNKSPQNWAKLAEIQQQIAATRQQIAHTYELLDYLGQHLDRLEEQESALSVWDA